MNCLYKLDNEQCMEKATDGCGRCYEHSKYNGCDRCGNWDFIESLYWSCDAGMGSGAEFPEWTDADKLEMHAFDQKVDGKGKWVWDALCSKCYSSFYTEEQIIKIEESWK